MNTLTYSFMVIWCSITVISFLAMTEKSKISIKTKLFGLVCVVLTNVVVVIGFSNFANYLVR